MAQQCNDQRHSLLWVADRGDGTYKNPIIFADYSDPDLVRVGNDFYMIASSFNYMPGIPVLHSSDLVNWRIVNHVFDRLPFPVYDRPAHGRGAWAPSLRYHDGKFWIFFCCPDEGLFMSTATDPAREWSPLHHVKPVTGWIDPCPFWDDDGQAYLVHAFANSRVGIKSVLHMCRMKPDGSEVIDDGGRIIFDGTENHPTMEGPKMYKREGDYIIFAPAGGVVGGWQVVLRSKNVYGPYEDRIVMAQGNTEINGPHQGGWVELESGESWFVHFQDRGAYGRVVHLQPMEWIDGWPVIGEDQSDDGVGEPVATAEKPRVGATYPVAGPQTTDEFEAKDLGLQWQWHANPQPEWASLTVNEGALRLHAMPAPAEDNLWYASNLLLQKFPAPAFTAMTRVTFRSEVAGEQAGLVVMGCDYAYVGLLKTADGLRIIQRVCADAGTNPSMKEVIGPDLTGESVYLRVSVGTGALCQFGYSEDGRAFRLIGPRFQARKGHWIGAKVGLFCIATDVETDGGFADFDWFRFGG